jgi:predicted permease
MGEIAVATALLLGAAIVAERFFNLAGSITGYDARNVVTFQLILPPWRYRNTDTREPVAEEVAKRLGANPQIDSIGYTNLLPLTPARWSVAFAIPGVPPETLRRDGPPQTRYVSRDYLRAIGVRLEAGRWFRETDDRTTRRVLLINRALTEKYFSGRNPVGQLVTLANEPAEIIGVVDNVREGRLSDEPGPQYYIQFRQLPTGIPPFPDLGGLYFAVRANEAPSRFVPWARGIIADIDREATLDSAFELEQLVAASIARPRLYVIVLATFSVIAATLAIVGIIGMVSYGISQRTREIGIRMALGATDADIIRMVLVESTRVAGVGLAVGCVGALAARPLLVKIVPGAGAGSVGIVLVPLAAFVALSTLAALFPLLRMLRTSPISSLRQE